MPPSDIETNFLPAARAIERTMDVLPTPGGPTKHSTGDLRLPVSLYTARYSSMRSFTFSSPKWSSLSTFLASASDSVSVVDFAHGKSSTRSIYDRDTVASGVDGLIFSSRDISLLILS